MAAGMQDFLYTTPTKVYFGKDADKDVGGVLKGYDFKKLLVLYGGGSAKKSGLLDKVTNSLDNAGIDYIMFGGVEPNPKLSYVHKILPECKAAGVDFVLAVGGGSVIDTAKSVALSIANDADPWDVTDSAKYPNETLKALPVATVLTLAAAGSEMSNSHVITNDYIPFKGGRDHDVIRPVVSFLNPVNTFTVSKYQTGCGIVDTMMHTFERYFTWETETELTDRMAEAIIMSVKNAGAVAIREPDNYAARADLMWASSVSHNGLTGSGKTFGTFPAHIIEHGISGVFDRVAHGAGLAVVYPAFAKYVYKKNVNRFCQMATRVWGIPMNYDNPEQTALDGINAMKAYFRSIGMPVSMDELEIGPEYFEEIANKITDNDKNEIWSYIPLKNKDIIRIFELSNED